LTGVVVEWEDKYEAARDWRRIRRCIRLGDGVDTAQKKSSGEPALLKDEAE
jgi:hypothetical protein